MDAIAFTATLIRTIYAFLADHPLLTGLAVLAVVAVVALDVALDRRRERKAAIAAADTEVFPRVGVDF